MRAVNLATVLKRLNATNINTNGRIEFKCLTTRSYFGVTKHNANLFTKLVDKDNTSFALACDCG